MLEPAIVRVASLMCAHWVIRCLLLVVLHGALGRTLLQKAADFNSLAHPEPIEVALRLAAEGLVQEAPCTGMGAEEENRSQAKELAIRGCTLQFQACQHKLFRRKTSRKHGSLRSYHWTALQLREKNLTSISSVSLGTSYPTSTAFRSYQAPAQAPLRQQRQAFWTLRRACCGVLCPRSETWKFRFRFRAF